MVTVATFETVEDAVPLKERLEKLGIHAEVQHQSKLQTFWMTHEHADVKLKVENKDLGNVKTLLEAWDENDGALDHAIRCPECHSSRVQFPQYTRKFILPGIANYVLSGFQNKYYCQDCHHIWPKKEQAAFSEM